jgi:RNA polymerase sigma-70 factor, ECF subfamily
VTFTEKASVVEGPDAGGSSGDWSLGAEDLKLLRLAAAGDGRAFHRLVDGHADRLFRIAVSLVGNSADAEDVVQETFIAALKGARGFEERASVKTWLTRILVTQAALQRRVKKRRREGPLGENVASASREGASDAALDLKDVLEQLSAEHRQVLVLREYERMSYDDIAEVLGVPRGTVESRLHRARIELREKLGSYRP